MQNKKTTELENNTKEEIDAVFEQYLENPQPAMAFAGSRAQHLNQALQMIYLQPMIDAWNKQSVLWQRLMVEDGKK